MSEKLDRKQYFKMFNGDELVAKVALSWKKSFCQRFVIPHKLRKCGDCKKALLCYNCDKLINQRKEFSANLNASKRQAPNGISHMLPEYIMT